MLNFMAQRFGCKWQNYQKIWKKWMQISLLNFDSKQEKKENLFSIRDIASCPFSLIREGTEAFLFMLNLLLVAVDTTSFKYVLFLKTFFFKSLKSLKKILLSLFSVRWISTSGFIFSPCSFRPYEGFSIKESETFLLLQSPLLVKAACLFFPHPWFSVPLVHFFSAAFKHHKSCNSLFPRFLIIISYLFLQSLSYSL